MATVKTWEEVKREIVYQKYSLKIERRDFILPDGRTDDFYIRVEIRGACILALTVDNKVITLPQYRPGPGKILRELPGGQVDQNEDPRRAAERELLEETGYTGELLNWVGKWYTDAYTDSDRQVFIARDCKKVANQQLEGNEFGEVELVDIAAFTTQVRAGELTDTGGAMLALDHLGLL